MTAPLLRWMIAAAAASFAGTTAAQDPARDAAAAEVRRLVADEIARTPPDSRRAREAVSRLYASDSARLLWSALGRPTAQALEIVGLLEGAAAKGLRPADYEAVARCREVTRLLAMPGTAEEAARFDVSLSRSALRLIDHLHAGRVDPRALGLDLPDFHESLDLAALLTAASRSDDMEALVAAAEPPYGGYASLLERLAQYRRLALDTTLDLEPVGGTIRPGGPYAGAPRLRRLLIALGDLPPGAVIVPDSAGAPRYGGALVQGIMTFQERHGLEADGIIGPATMRALRVPIADRVRQIELTLERWRWLPDRPAPRRLMVNTAAFELSFFDGDSTGAGPALSMRIIVGEADGRHETPAFTATLREVVFRPYWNVPPRIARLELVPLLRRDPSYLGREGFEIVLGGDEDAVAFSPTSENLDRVAAGGLRLRQRPGPLNALGAVKFVFPNRYSVYMHGTPAQHLFARSRRDFSHGCIRVEDPATLAEWILRGQAPWDRPAIEAAMNGDRTIHVTVERLVAVYVLYATALVDERGTARFLPDVYGHDAALAKALWLTMAGDGSRASGAPTADAHESPCSSAVGR